MTKNHLKNLPIKQAFRVLKAMLGGNHKIAKACRVSPGWVNRWGSAGRAGVCMVIPEEHFDRIVSISGGMIEIDDLRDMNRRAEEMNARERKKSKS